MPWSPRADGLGGPHGDGSAVELPGPRVPMTATRSSTCRSKLFTSIVVMRQHELGRFELDDPVAEHLPEFGVNGKSSITVEQLLTHTSGLVAWLPLWSRYPDVPSRVKAVMDTTPVNPPGTTYVYSDLNLITLGLLAQKWSGTSLDVLVREGITAPLGLKDTGYNPPGKLTDRGTETRPPGHRAARTTERNAGVSRASACSPARNWPPRPGDPNGADGGRTVPDTVSDASDVNQAFRAARRPGLRADQRWYMGADLPGPPPPFTGDAGARPAVGSIAILLTNRVPSRDWGSDQPSPAGGRESQAEAMAVKPRPGARRPQAAPR
ncbi:beta-lactamase family protein [Saccharothrix sp. MB29]|nr:beta-lactamase family protein [Saccharothrix sp. MB29]